MAITRWRPFRSIEHWQPFHDLDVLRQEMDKLFEQFLPGLGETNGDFPFIPSAELEQTDTHLLLKLEVPGMRAEDLDIEVTDTILSVKGERKSENKTEENGVTRSEFRYGQFERVIPLPVQVDRTQVTAEYKDGILRLTLPKSTAEKSEAMKVKVV